MYKPQKYVPTPGLMIPVHKEISVYYHPQDAAEWAKYLQAKLGEREYQIDTVLNDITSGPIFKVKTRVNVFLISPSFLELTDMKIMAGFDSHFSLALLMGVDMDDFTFMTTKCDVYEQVNEWVKFEVQESEESVRTLLMTIVSMYETDPDSFSPYDVLPPRIRPVNEVKNIIQEVTEQGINIYIGLVSKVDSDVYIKFDGVEEDVKATFLKSHFYSFKLTDEMAQTFSTFKVMCKNQLLGEGQLDDCAPSPQRTKADFDMTQLKTSLVLEPREPSKLTDQQSKLDKIRTILEEEINPISLLCQCMALHGADRGRLDKILADKIVASGLPGHMSIVESPERLSQVQSDQKWPTLLHFAAEYNLMTFAEALLMQPALEGTCFIKNCDGHTPADIAKNAGHLELSDMLIMYSQLLLSSCGGKHDSGYRGSGNKAPRLSQIKRFAEYRDSSPVSMTSLPPPAPHGSSYVDASGYSKPPKPRPLHVSGAPNMRDSGLDNPCDNIIEEHVELENMEEQSIFRDEVEASADERKYRQGIVSRTSDLRAGGSKIFFAHENPELTGERRTVTSKCYSEGDKETTGRQDEGISPPFHSLLDIGKTYSDFEEFGKERRPSIDSGREADNRSHQKEKAPPQAKKEKRSFFPFLNKRRRAKSEPFISLDGGKIYKRQTTSVDRESNISTSSSGSSFSETSEHDLETVTPRIREKTKDKSKKKIKLFLKSAEKRKSVRLCHAMEEKNMMYPSLPPKKSTFLDDFN